MQMLMLMLMFVVDGIGKVLDDLGENAEQAPESKSISYGVSHYSEISSALASFLTSRILPQSSLAVL